MKTAELQSVQPRTSYEVKRKIQFDVYCCRKSKKYIFFQLPSKNKSAQQKELLLFITWWTPVAQIHLQACHCRFRQRIYSGKAKSVPQTCFVQHPVTWVGKISFCWSRRNTERRRWKELEEMRKQRVARERPSGEDENQAHKRLDFDPAAQNNGW